MMFHRTSILFLTSTLSTFCFTSAFLLGSNTEPRKAFTGCGQLKFCNNVASQSFAFDRFEVNRMERHESVLYAKKTWKKKRRRRKNGDSAKKKSTQNDTAEENASPNSAVDSNIDNPPVQNESSEAIAQANTSTGYLLTLEQKPEITIEADPAISKEKERKQRSLMETRFAIDASVKGRLEAHKEAESAKETELNQRSLMENRFTIDAAVKQRLEAQKEAEATRIAAVIIEEKEAAKIAASNVEQNQRSLMENRFTVDAAVKRRLEAQKEAEATRIAAAIIKEKEASKIIAKESERKQRSLIENRVTVDAVAKRRSEARKEMEAARTAAEVIEKKEIAKVAAKVAEQKQRSLMDIRFTIDAVVRQRLEAQKEAEATRIAAEVIQKREAAVIAANIAAKEAEEKQRSLMENRFTIDASLKQRSVAQAARIAAEVIEKREAAEIAAKIATKEAEQSQRSLMQNRFTIDASLRRRFEAQKQAEMEVEASRIWESAKQAERKQRTLIGTRFEVQVAERNARIAAEEAEFIRIATEVRKAQIELDRKQRAVLKSQIGIEAAKRAKAKALREAEAAKIAARKAKIKAREDAIAEAKRGPKSEEEKKELALRYGAMDVVDRAFTILYDLGMVEITPDPQDPDYDNEFDNELAPVNIFI